MILFLDTSSQQNFQIVIIEKDKIVFNKKYKAKNRLDDIFKELKNIDLNKIKYFATNIGPKNLDGENASFTGLRVSSVIGNTMFMANRVKLMGLEIKGKTTIIDILDIISKKIQDKDFPKILLPNYSNKPNITTRGSRWDQKTAIC